MMGDYGRRITDDSVDQSTMTAPGPVIAPTGSARIAAGSMIYWLSLLPGFKSRNPLTLIVLTLVYLVLLVFAPILAYVVMVTAFLIRNTYGLRSQTPLIRSRRRLVSVPGWIVWASLVLLVILGELFLVAVATLLLMDHFGYRWTFVGTMILIEGPVVIPVAVLTLILAVWELAGRSDPTMRRHLLNLLAMWLLPPLGIALLKSSRGSPATTAWARVGWGLGILCWLRITIWAMVIVSLLDPHDVNFWKICGALVTRYLIVGLVIVLVAAIVRQSYFRALRAPRKQLPLATEPDNALSLVDQFRTTVPKLRLNGWIASNVLIGAWMAILLWALLPWILVLSSDLHKGQTAVNVYLPIATTLVAALPVTVISLRSLGKAIVGAVRSEGWSWAHCEPSRAYGTAFVVALVMVVSGLLINAFNAETTTHIQYLWLVGGMSIGLSTGVSVGIARHFRVGVGGMESSCRLVATLFCLVLAVYLIETEGWDIFSPRLNWSSWALWPVAAVSGLLIGFVLGDVLLMPGLLSFSKSTKYIREMGWDLVGWVTGYLFIGLTFTAIYYGLYKLSGNSAVGFPGKTEDLTLEDIAYFSMNTITPLGYTEVRAANGVVRLLTLLELLSGLVWTVVVFGAVLTNLTEGHIQRIVRESESLRRQQRAGPPDTSLPTAE